MRRKEGEKFNLFIQPLTPPLNPSLSLFVLSLFILSLFILSLSVSLSLADRLFHYESQY